MGESNDGRLVNLMGALSLALVDRLRHDTEDAAGQTSAAPAALVALHEFLGGGSVDQLRRVVGLTPSGAVRLVDRLVDMEYVERRPGHDARSIALVLTARGRRAARRVLDARAESLRSVFAELDDEEQRTLTRTVEHALRAVTRQRLDDRREGREVTGGWLCRLCDFAACGRDRGLCPAAGTAANEDN